MSAFRSLTEVFIELRPSFDTREIDVEGNINDSLIHYPCIAGIAEELSYKQTGEFIVDHFNQQITWISTGRTDFFDWLVTAALVLKQEFPQIWKQAEKESTELVIHSKVGKDVIYYGHRTSKVLVQLPSGNVTFRNSYTGIQPIKCTQNGEFDWANRDGNFPNWNVKDACLFWSLLNKEKEWTKLRPVTDETLKSAQAIEIKSLLSAKQKRVFNLYQSKRIEPIKIAERLWLCEDQLVQLAIEEKDNKEFPKKAKISTIVDIRDVQLGRRDQAEEELCYCRLTLDAPFKLLIAKEELFRKLNVEQGSACQLISNPIYKNPLTGTLVNPETNQAHKDLTCDERLYLKAVNTQGNLQEVKFLNRTKGLYLEGHGLIIDSSILGKGKEGWIKVEKIDITVNSQEEVTRVLLNNQHKMTGLFDEPIVTLEALTEECDLYKIPYDFKDRTDW